MSAFRIQIFFFLCISVCAQCSAMLRPLSERALEMGHMTYDLHSYVNREVRRILFGSIHVLM